MGYLGSVVAVLMWNSIQFHFNYHSTVHLTIGDVKASQTRGIDSLYRGVEGWEVVWVIILHVF